VPETVAMKMTGHEARSLFDHYNIAGAGYLDDAARKLDRYHVTGTSTGTVDNGLADTIQSSVVGNRTTR
jgi:hypothetical protein